MNESAPHTRVDMSSAAIDQRLRELSDLYDFWQALRTIRPVPDDTTTDDTTSHDDATHHLAPGQ